MTTTVQSVLDRVKQTLQDTAGIRWSETNELIKWVNDAQREIALLKPDATSENTTVTLVTGTKQTLPADGNRLLRVIRNMSAASSGTGGRAIRLVARDVLDTQTPTWHDPAVTGDAAHTNVVKNYIYDEQDPTNYYVFPGVSGNAYIEIVYSKNPPTVTAGTDNLGVDDIFANAVMNYVLYMAFMKESESAGNAQRASSHYNLFTASVTGKAQIDTITTPNIDRRGDA
tara:strand:+ start:534 stop:1217 length:684 start_codon:yes stop_codon:yes gene_type:complete